jgi:hypothetical protein
MAPVVAAAGAVVHIDSLGRLAMPTKVIAGAAPDEPSAGEPVADVAELLDDVAIERVLAEWSARMRYGKEFPDRYQPVLPTLSAAELRAAGERMRDVRRRRGRAYRFVCSRRKRHADSAFD